tara:strand:+ start:897 stop:1331 length:435 start_codon:yes stop_codon:yes gene_type:complete
MKHGMPHFGWEICSPRSRQSSIQVVYLLRIFVFDFFEVCVKLEKFYIRVGICGPGVTRRRPLILGLVRNCDFGPIAGRITRRWLQYRKLVRILYPFILVYQFQKLFACSIWFWRQLFHGAFPIINSFLLRILLDTILSVLMSLK